MLSCNVTCRPLSLTSHTFFYFKFVIVPGPLWFQRVQVLQHCFQIQFVFSGQSKVVLKPKTTKEVSQILSYCNGRRLAVCPQGGNTSVVGGAVPVFDEIVISFSLMNKIISLDEISGTFAITSSFHLTLAFHLTTDSQRWPMSSKLASRAQPPNSIYKNKTHAI